MLLVYYKIVHEVLIKTSKHTWTWWKSKKSASLATIRPIQLWSWFFLCQLLCLHFDCQYESTTVIIAAFKHASTFAHVQVHISLKILTFGLERGPLSVWIRFCPKIEILPQKSVEGKKGWKCEYWKSKIINLLWALTTTLSALYTNTKYKYKYNSYFYCAPYSLTDGALQKSASMYFIAVGGLK